MEEVPDDGIDQDCDGQDATTPDSGQDDSGQDDSGQDDSGQDDSGRDDSGPTEKRCGCGAVAPIPSLPLALVFLALARRPQRRRAAPEECPASDAAERRAGG